MTAAKNGASIHITPQGGGYFPFTDEGNLIRAQLTPAGYREISRSHLIDPTWPFDGRKFVYAPPAFANRHVFARSEGERVRGIKRAHSRSRAPDERVACRGEMHDARSEAFAVGVGEEHGEAGVHDADE